MVEFKFPDVGEGIAEGEIVRWLVREGETVRAHQPIVEMETDKAVVELPSPVPGTIKELRGGEGETVAVGTVLAVIDDGGEPSRKTEPEKEPPARAPSGQGVVGQIEEAEEEEPAPAPEREKMAPRLLPRDRKLAAELGVDPARLEGEGPGGRITEEQIRAAAKQGEGPAAAEEEQRLPLKGVRRSMAKAMSASAFSAVHVTIMERADAGALRELRDRERDRVAERGGRLTYLPFLIKALTLALERHPLLNSRLDEERQEIVLFRRCHVGLAVDTPDGLLVPVIRDARRRSILELAERLEDIAARARERKLEPEELKGGTFTVSNYGALGGLWGTPIINPPEAAILGLGRIEETPVVRGGQVVARPVAPLSLTFDHRIIDGATAQRFLNSLVEHIENPDLILLET